MCRIHPIHPPLRVGIIRWNIFIGRLHLAKLPGQKGITLSLLRLQFLRCRAQKLHCAFCTVHTIRHQPFARHGRFIYEAGQILRLLQRPYGRGLQLQASGLHSGGNAPAYFFHHTAWLCARQPCAGYAQFHRMQPGCFFPFIRARMRRAAPGVCIWARSARGFPQGAYLCAHRAVFLCIPCVCLCVCLAASAPGTCAGRLPFGLLFFVCAHSLRQPLRHLFAFFFCVALYCARKGLAPVPKIAFSPFFHRAVSFLSSVRFLCARAGARAQRKRPPGAPPGGHAAHAARCVRP